MLNKKYWASLLAGSLLLLQGCQSLPQTQQLRHSPPAGLSHSKLIENVPFYPQQAFYCGPTTLAEVLNYHGRQTTPEAIAPNLFIPGREGSLQLEMVSAARSHGLLPYSANSDLGVLLSLVDDNVPVIVLQNVATSWFPMWHYALVIGFDQSTETIILHTGQTQAHQMSYELFERVWQRGSYWMLALLKDHQAFPYLEPYTYIRAAYDMLTTGQQNAALANLETATKTWPTQWLPYFLLGNYYLGKSSQSAEWFSKGYEFAKDKAEYLNNYSYALKQQGCVAEAKNLIKKALKITPSDKTLLATKNEFDLISQSEQANSPKHCSSYVF